MLAAPSGDDLTLWLKRMSAGEAEAAEHVATAVYQELHRLAGALINWYNSTRVAIQIVSNAADEEVKVAGGGQAIQHAGSGST